MARKRNLPSIVVDYDQLNDTYKAIYDHIAASFDDKNIYEIRREAAEAGVESPTTLGKKELIKRITDRLVYPYLPAPEKRDYKPWDLFKSTAGEERVKGFCEFHDGEWLVGKVVIFPFIAREHDLREGDYIEGKVGDVSGVKMLVTIIKLENDGIKRRWFSEIRVMGNRPCPIEGTRAGELFDGLRVGERVIMKNMPLSEANKIAESFKYSVKLFLGLAPEWESDIKSETFITEFALGKAEVASVVRLSLERCKRLAEMGKEVAYVVTGFDSLDDFDLERSVFGVGRSFGKGGVTVIAEMDEKRRSGAFAKIATRIM